MIVQISWNADTRLEYFRLRGNAQISAFAKKLYKILFAMKINHKFAVGSQPETVGGGGAEALNAAAERENPRRKAGASKP